MSETQTQSYTPAPTPARKGISVWVWALVLLLAVAALVGAVMWAGGPGDVAKLVGLDTLSIPSFSLPSFGGGGGGTGGAQPSASAAASATASTATSDSVVPTDVQARMYTAQLQSQTELLELISGNVSRLDFGRPILAETSATVPVSAVYDGKRRLSGKLTFWKSGNMWFLFSLMPDAGLRPEDLGTPHQIDQGVVSTITQQQAQADTQEMISDGVLGGGYKVVTVDGVQNGPRTATVDLTLSGGSLPEAKGRLVFISASDGSSTYWFVASFKKR